VNIRHFQDAKQPRPQFRRFGYAEKAEYWALVWGTIIMGATGLMLWAKMWVTQWLPRWAIDVATTVHLYEAILATLAIIVWHFYFVIFDPDIYPLNWAWFDGRVNREHYREEHPLDTPEEIEFDDQAKDEKEAE
jgi:cytochrome b subunit of formate dehydrogenase